MKSTSLISGVLLSLGLSLGFASAAMVWNEAVNGNLSNNRMTPTPITLSSGMNTIKGSLVGAFGDGLYHDYVTFAVPAGFALLEFKIDALTNANSRNAIMGIASGNTFPTEPNGSNANLMLGWTAVSPGSVGANVLPNMAKADNGNVGNSGFSIPLGAGTYSVWFQDYDTPAAYQVSLRIEATVPPTIAIARKKVSGKKAVISGTTGGAVTSVSYRFGKGKFKAVKGSPESWTVMVSKLKKGKNVVQVQATGIFGTSMTKVIIVKK